MSLLRRNRIKKNFLKRKSRKPSSKTRRKTKIVSTKSALPVKLMKQTSWKRRLELRKRVSIRTKLLVRPYLMKRLKIRSAKTRPTLMPGTTWKRKKGKSGKIMKPLKPTSRRSRMKMLRETVLPKKKLIGKDKPPRMLRRQSSGSKSKMLKTNVMKPNVNRNSYK